MRPPLLHIPADLFERPALLVFASHLGVDPVVAVGILMSLWTVTRTVRVTGDLAGLSPGVIADMARWDGDGHLLVSALRAAGLLDATSWQLMGWSDLAGRDDERRAKDAARKRRQRENAKSHDLSRGLSQGQSRGQGYESKEVVSSSVMSSNGKFTESERNVTGGDETLIDDLIGAQTALFDEPETEPEGESEPEDELVVEFGVLWEEYPARAGGNSRADAYRAFVARRRQGVGFPVIRDGLARYRAYCEAMGMIGTQYVKAAATFFGPGRHYEGDFEIPPTRRPGARQPTGEGYVATTQVPAALLSRRREIPSNPDPGF